MISERNILIWLNAIGISKTKIVALKEFYTDLSSLWYDNSCLYSKLNILNDNMLYKINKYRNNKFLEDLLLKLENNNINTITIFDSNYPKDLTNIPDKPLVIYTRGEYKEEDHFSIGIVGSRKATAYGKWACEKFTKELVALGITIISGLALGIDTVAHKTAIENGGRTIGVLGNGLDYIYPKSNYKLYEEVANNGCVMTEFPMGTQPVNYNFPQRNRIISGLSLGVIIIEANEKSGSLITAHHALEQGKEVFALPGNINSIYSKGTNRLIKDGAKPLLDIDDIIEEVYELNQIQNIKLNSFDESCLSDDEKIIMNLISNGPIHADNIVLKSGIDISNVMSILTILELKGMIREISSRVFSSC
jgi:DNA processing protein